MTTTSSIHLVKTLYFGTSSFWKLKNMHNLWQKRKKQINVQRQIRQSRLKSAFFIGLMQKNEDIAILSHSAHSIVEDSQFWLTVPEILWATLYVFKKLLEIFFDFLKGQSLKILGGHK